METPIPVDTEKFTVANSSTLCRDSKVFDTFKVAVSVGWLASTVAFKPCRMLAVVALTPLLKMIVLDVELVV
ncbi:hypothetical protein D3C84_1143330 [compost metagenome]